MITLTDDEVALVKALVILSKRSRHSPEDNPACSALSVHGQMRRLGVGSGSLMLLGN